MDKEASTQARILVIDDEEVLHVSLKRTLGRQGHDVEAVFTATEGLQRIDEDHFDMVITDLMMPEIDGIGLLKQLQQKRTTVPVLMITGYPTIRTALQALRLGAVDYLAKPFTREELLGPVNRTLRRTADPLTRQPTSELLMVAAARAADGIEAPDIDLTPGDRFTLPGHSWAVFQQDGTMEVGIEQSFLHNAGQIEEIELPHEAEVVEQGYVGFRLRTTSGEAHNVFMPITGPVVAVNDAATAPASIDQQTWLVRIVPSQLEKELKVLLKRE